MENSNIIAFIKSNLNQDFEHDFNYLMKELSHYQSLPGTEKIVLEIINLLKSELGDEGVKRFNETVQSAFKKRIDKFNEAIKLLNPRELDIISRRYGLFNKPVETQKPSESESEDPKPSEEPTEEPAT